MSRFTLPRDIYYGANALENLKNLKGSRAVLVLGGGSMKKFGFVDKALGYLKEAGIETRLIENVEPDPSVETVMSGAAVMREFEPDWIISMGGGSPIDAAKAMWAFYEYPETTFEDLITPFSFPELRQKAKFCAIPSTSGTATEVTAFSVITDYQKGIKYPLADFNITPDVAIIDPALAETMPPKLVAHTGMDALTHAIEAYVSTLHTVFTDPLALKAIHIVEKDLLRSFNGDMSCREEMHYGQCLAGMAFCWALSTPWPTRPARPSPPATSPTAWPTPCTCPTSSPTTPKPTAWPSAMPTSPAPWASWATPPPSWWRACAPRSAP